MKLHRYASVLALVAGFAGFSLLTGAQPPQLPKPPPPPASIPGRGTIHGSARDSVATTTSSEPEGVDEVRPEPRQERRVRSSDPEARSSRRRGRNRYPGPIPTPEEWEPPEGPVRIALQAGHWKAYEAPSELSGLRDNGTRWGDRVEWEANLEIARQAASMLEDLGYAVDILPAVVPPGYRAHLFISIHADGSTDPGMSGYRVAPPRRDATGRASGFSELLREIYGKETGLAAIPTVTRRMQNYYAFNFRRYEHALHPMTIGVIIETGFLTSARDRQVIVDDPALAARGIVEAIKAFPVTPPPTSSGRSPGGL